MSSNTIINTENDPKDLEDIKELESSEDKIDNGEINEIIDKSTENGKNKMLNGNEVDVDILPKVGGNSIIINVCSCFNWSYSDADKKK